MKALQKGAKLGLMFQSLRGTESGLRAFGTDIGMLREAWDMTRKLGTATGPNVMYFETGQGSALSANAHHGVDQLTCEARNYGIARYYQPFWSTPSSVPSVQNICSMRARSRGPVWKITSWASFTACRWAAMRATQTTRTLTTNDPEKLGNSARQRGLQLLYGSADGDDIMLNYQSTSFHDDATMREVLGLRPAPEFEAWMERVGLWENGRLSARAGDATLLT